MANETGQILLTLTAAVGVHVVSDLQHHTGTPVVSVVAGGATAAVLIAFASVSPYGEIAEAIAFAILVGVLYATYGKGNGPTLTAAFTHGGATVGTAATPSGVVTSTGAPSSTTIQRASGGNPYRRAF